MGRLIEEVKRRPILIVKKRINLPRNSRKGFFSGIPVPSRTTGNPAQTSRTAFTDVP